MHLSKLIFRHLVSRARAAVLALAALSFFAGPSLAENDVKIEWVAHSFFRITSPDGTVILTNPWYANRDSSITLEDIPAADIILVPAGHGDEVGNTLEIAAKTGATIFASHEVINQQWKEAGAGFRTPVKFEGTELKTRAVQPGSEFTVDGVTIRAVNAVHGNGRTGGPAMGFMITMENGYTLYFSGSTDITLDMKLWGEMFQPDVALLAYAPAQRAADVALMAKFLTEGNPNLTTVFAHHNRLNADAGDRPSDLAAAMTEAGLSATLIDAKPGTVYSLAK